MHTFGSSGLLLAAKLEYGIVEETWTLVLISASSCTVHSVRPQHTVLDDSVGYCVAGFPMILLAIGFLVMMSSSLHVHGMLSTTRAVGSNAIISFLNVTFLF